MNWQGKRALLDVNVWLDYFLPERGRQDIATRLITAACREGIDLLSAASSAGNVFYLVNQDLKRDARLRQGVLTERDAVAIREVTWACIDCMDELATPVAMDVSDLWKARKYRAVHDDLEDNLVLAACERAQVDYLVTSDEELLRKANVAALSPEDMLALLEAA